MLTSVSSQRESLQLHNRDSGVPARHLRRCSQVFRQVKALLIPGGLFFLRANAASTQIHQPHTIIEQNDLGGMTIRYEAGPKEGLPIHFYTSDELIGLTRDYFDVVEEPCEDVTLRTPPETGSWVQWEGIWRRRHIE